MKTQLHNLILALVALIVMGHVSTAQVLLKDLEPAANISSGPHQFTMVDGTLYFFTDPGNTRLHALWKTDGTEAGTVKVKDSLIGTSVSDRLMMRGVSNDTLFFTINTNVQADTTTELWMVKNGSAPVLVTELTSRRMQGIFNGEPRRYTMAGGKLFFQMYTEHGYELWVSDGTAAGTHEVADLFPGSSSSVANGGAADLPMIGYNGKVYFQGMTSYLTGIKGLYSSDGTTIELVKEGPNFNPRSFAVFNNTLYFYAESATAGTGLWKTDGTTPGTENVATSGFNGDIVVFKNFMYYNVGNTMYKSDGSTAGTAVFSDTIGSVYGMNNDYFFSRTYSSIPTPPYIQYSFWRSTGAAGGTERIDAALGNSASFVTLNNKMYGVGLDNILRESDGTAAGVNRLDSGIISSPNIVNNKLVYSRFGSGTGYEPWVYVPAGGPTSLVESKADGMSLNMYPNPTSGIISLITDAGLENAVVEVYNIRGEKVFETIASGSQTEIDLTGRAKGLYIVKVNNGSKVYCGKLLLE